MRIVFPSWLTQTSTSASRCGRNTSSSACTASPPVCAAWNDVPQPVNSTRPSGRRRSVGTWRSHSGCAAIAARVSSPFAMTASIPSRRVSTYERTRPPERPPHRDGADAAGAVRLVLRDARGRLALRDRRVERHRALRGAHVLQGDGEAADGARHLGRDRRDRRRVQRLHGQGDHGLLRPLRRREPRHRARRARGHAPQLPLRRRGDRAREGRDHRGDEHVLRHAARLHLRHLRRPRLGRPPARLGHPRPQGDDPRRDARDVPLVSRPLVHG